MNAFSEQLRQRAPGLPFPKTPNNRIAVIIPCYRVKADVLSVIDSIGPEVDIIYAVDDGCPEGSGKEIEDNSEDARVRVLYHSKNEGVGAAMLTGYLQALEDGATILVKIDGDGQMDPRLIPDVVAPILFGEADYTKGNRFFNPADVIAMPLTRLIGNAVLSFLSKMSSGYWSIFDPTNGYTALHASLLYFLPTHKISRRFFFESDMLFHLYLLRAVVVDIPMASVYHNEKSNLLVRRVFKEFAVGHLRNLCRRVFFVYFLRDFSIASLNLIFGSVLITFGMVFGIVKWNESIITNTYASSGTVILAALPILLGVQLLLAFLSYDIMNQPRHPVHMRLAWRRRGSSLLKQPVSDFRFEGC
jgi:dolichol-phosphate mannosyltransferase